MRADADPRPALKWAGLIAAVCFAVSAFSGAGARQESPEPERIGKDMCLVCHTVSPGFLRSPHAAAECEDCHGPGGLHFESGGDEPLKPAAASPSEVVRDCLVCHSESMHLGAFPQSTHGRADLACISCHRIHPERFAAFGLLKQDANLLCADCHGLAAAEFKKPFHHPVLQGAMRCIDCHDAHLEDSFRAIPNTERQNACLDCHSEKRGPFVFEHLAVRANSCQSCHQPHGSVHARMLKRSQEHQLCLECHSMTAGIAGSQPPAFHDIRSPRFRNCTICHREIHGSNASPFFLR